MTISEIKQSLTTKFTGKNLHIYWQINSTNEEAIRQALNGAPEGTLILTETQTAGRGRHGRSWIAPAQSSILGSIILYPKIDSRQLGIIPLLTAVAVARSIRAMTGLTAMIKWPNDVMIYGKKVSGILVETGPMNSLIVGFGVNVNISQENMPQLIRTTASSIQIALGYKFSRTKLLCSLLVNFEELYLLLNDGKKDEILAEIRDLSCTIGRYVSIKQGNLFSSLDQNCACPFRRQEDKSKIYNELATDSLRASTEQSRRNENIDRVITGNACAIEDDGGLLILSEYGTLEKVYSGEITTEKVNE